MSIAENIMKRASARQILLYSEDGKLKFKAPSGAMDDSFLAQLKEHKKEILKLLEQSQELLSNEAAHLPPLVALNLKEAQLSHSQKRLWFIDRISQDKSQYNMPIALALRGALDVVAAQSAIRDIIERHEILRTVIIETTKGPIQRVQKNFSFALQQDDLSHLNRDEQQRVVEERLVHHANEEFDLSKDLMVRVDWLSLCNDDSNHRGVLLFNMHHIASDAWSVAVLIKEFVQIYQAICDDSGYLLEPLEIQYSDYADWQRRWLSDDVLRNQLIYWKKQLLDVPATHSLPLDRSRTDRYPPNKKQISGSVSQSVTEKLKQLAIENNMTVFMVLHAAIAVVISRHSNSTDILLGTPVANRLDKKLEPLIGLFVNTLVLRANTNDSSKQGYLQHIRQVNLDAQANQDVPFDYLVEQCKVLRSTQHLPLFQIMFGMNTTQSASLSLPGLKIEALKNSNGVAKFELDIRAEDTETGISFSWAYDSGLFDDSTIKSFQLHLERVLEGFVDERVNRLSQIQMLTESERDLLINARNNSVFTVQNAQRIEALFEQQVERSPDQIALSCDGQSFSYDALNKAANQYAHKLRLLGVENEVLVGLCLPRTPELVISILGVLKAGGAYVPLDPNYPKARLDHIVSDSGLTFLLHNADICPAIDSRPGLSCIDIVSSDWRSGVSDQLTTNPINEHLESSAVAYIIYTSGSTGEPKGVAIEHLSTFALLDWSVSHFEQELRSVLFSTSVCFDISVFELFAALTFGGQIVMVENILSLNDDVAEVALVNTVPSAMEVLLETNNLPASVTTVNLAGEPLSQSLVDKLYSQGVESVYDLYGPTEDTVYSTCALRSVGGEATIGRPIARTHAFILDDNLQLLPDGAIGELYLAGAGLARGYLNRPQLTNEKFVPNPFGKGRMYRTGDLVRYLDDGRIVYVGRIDEQVKIRGHRIELGEIEHQLELNELVKQSVVLAKENASSQRALVAYIEMERSEKFEVDDWYDELKQHLLSCLPSYMIPDAWVKIEEWPLTSSGKIDKNSLAQPVKEPVASAFDKPRDELEQLLCQIWQEVLQVERVGTRQAFFDIGGNSLLSYLVQQHINRRTPYNIELTDLFTYTTIRDLSTYLTRSEEPQKDVVVGSSVASESVQETVDVAIIGMACRFPDADSPEKFWRNLCNEHESVRQFSDSELLASGTPKEFLDKPEFLKSGVLLNDLDMFDSDYFGFTPREAQILDPQMRLLFECSNDALDHAGYGAIRSDERNVGVFIGISDSNYLIENILVRADIIEQVGFEAIRIGNTKDYSATRLSHKLNLTGPSVSTSTACSTSLVTVHQACQSLQKNECKMALAGGASIDLLRPKPTHIQEGSFKSLDGKCRAFDERASGTRGGSGAGLVLLKPLTQALQDGDTIHAVIKGSAINNDGSEKVGYSAPSVLGQARVIQTALRRANVPPESIAYVETHGTGTHVGDPIEIAGLKRAFGSSKTQFCALGTTKPNIGHLASAAGIAGLIKTVLVLKNRAIPKALYFERPNRQIDFSNSPFYVSDRLHEYESTSGLMTAGVSSFGFGGTNAHAILQEAPLTQSAPTKLSTQLVTFSASSETVLNKMQTRLAGFLALNGQVSLADLSFTLAVGRAKLSHRRHFVCNSITELQTQLQYELPVSILDENVVSPDISFVSSWRCRNWKQTDRESYLFDTRFKHHYELCAGHINKLMEVNILESVLESSDHDFGNSHHAQATLFAYQYSLAKLWLDLGIAPNYLFGHGLSEYVVACVSGVFSVEDAIRLLAARLAMNPQSSFEYVIVRSPKTKLRTLLGQYECDLSDILEDELFVVQGDAVALNELQNELSAQGIEFEHKGSGFSDSMSIEKETRQEYLKLISSMSLGPAQLPFISNLTGQTIKPEQASSPEYWCQLLSFTRNLQGCMETLSQKSGGIALEVCPTNSMKESIEGLNGAVTYRSSTASDLGHRNNRQHYLDVLGELWCRGVEIDWLSLHDGERRRIPLPAYAYDRKRLWVDVDYGKVAAALPINNIINDLDQCFYQPTWHLAPQRQQPDASQKMKLCLVFEDDEKLCRKLHPELQSLAEKVIFVREGERFEVLDASSFSINPEELSDYQTLFESLESRPGLIIHAWNVGPHVGDWQFSEELLERNLYSLWQICRVLKPSNEITSIKLLTTQGACFDENEVIHADRAMHSAMAKVVNQEYEYISCQHIDLHLSEQLEDHTLLINQISNFEEMHVQCLRLGRSWKLGYVPMEKRCDRFLIRENGVFAISGGLGGIGLTLAESIAEKVNAKLILIGRSEFVPRHDWDQYSKNHDNTNSNLIATILRIEALGSQIEYYQADVSNGAQLNQIGREIETRYGAVNGFIHAAGVAGQGLMALKTKADISRTVAAKVSGTYLLASTFASDSLDWFINCSSVSTILGGSGQYDYSAANAFQNGFSSAFKSSKTQYISLAWDTWKEVGMAENTRGDVTIGAHGITPQEGKLLFQKVLNNNLTHQVVISKRDILRLSTVRDHKEPSNVEQTISPDAEQMTDALERPDLKVDFVAPQYDIEKKLASIWTELLGITPIGVNDNFFELGGDSLLLTRMLAKANRSLSSSLTIRQAFDSGTVHELALLVVSQMDFTEDENSDEDYEEEVLL